MKSARSGPMADRIFGWLAKGAAIFTLVTLIAILASLTVSAWPAIDKDGLGFLTSTTWDPVNEEFGGLVMIYGNLVTSFIALLIAVPVSFGIALFLTEISPAWLKRPLGTAIELLAVVPSIVYGMWGLLVFSPILSTYVQQPLQGIFGDVPYLGALFSGPPVGIGILSAGIILAIMIIPFIAAVMRDVFEVTPTLVNQMALTLSLMAMGFGLFWLFWILFETVSLGIGGLTLDTLTQMTPPPNELGGLANAMYGSFLMVLLATFVGTPIGILAGIYLAEFEPKGWLANTIRFVNDILLSAPSIVIGLFVYAVIVARFKSFSGWAGAMALALIVIPVVIRTTENMLQLIPAGLRAAAYALGAPKWKVILSITLKAARAGVVTGIMLAVARIAGETAPLLFTALNNQFWTSSLNQPTASLPVTIFKFAMSPYENWQKLAWAGVFLITMAVLGLNIAARIFTRAK